ncbi:MAG: tetratricopeptide (TPR) repeat protein, partial [Myxococcota bacterium]
ELEAAKGRIEEVLEIRRRTADWAGQATCFVGLGAIRYMEGDLDGALEGWREGLALAEYAGDRDLMGALLNNIGEVELEQGDHVRAKVTLTDALSVTRDTGDQRTAADVARNLAALSATLGDFDAAMTQIDEAQAICEAIGARPALGQVLRTRATILSQRASPGAGVVATGDPAGALFERAIALFDGLGDQMELSRTVSDYAEHLSRHGDEAGLTRLRATWPDAK